MKPSAKIQANGQKNMYAHRPSLILRRTTLLSVSTLSFVNTRLKSSGMPSYLMVFILLPGNGTLITRNLKSPQIGGSRILS